MKESEKQDDRPYTIVHHLAVRDMAVSSIATADAKLQAIEEWLFLNPEVLDKSRKRHLVDQRRMLCYLLRKHTKLSLTSIGKMLGGKDHATILYNYKTHVELWKSNDQEYKFNTRELSSRFNNLI